MNDTVEQRLALLDPDSCGFAWTTQEFLALAGISGPPAAWRADYAEVE